jgi:predicted nucleic acid-binding OB-fold protein
MNLSEWGKIRQIVGQAKLILEEFAMLKHGLDPATQSKVKQAQKYLADLQNSDELQRAAENIEYQKLLDKLQAEDKKISQQVHEGAKDFFK